MYLPLRNYKYDSGPNRIQSGPDHEGYIVLTSGVQSAGADQGFIVDGSPLSGTLTDGAWGYDGNWRYVPYTTTNSTTTLNGTPYNVSGALDTYDNFRVPSVITVAGAQVSTSIGSQTGYDNPQDDTPPASLYYGGNAPSNQDYSPFNTPGSNTAAEGKTGGGVTHGIYEGTALTNILGSQGTSDRSQWRYHQPVYCKTYTETVRSKTPGLMSSPLRYTYRGGATAYSVNYGEELLSSRGGFDFLLDNYPPRGQTGSGFLTYISPLRVSDTISCTPLCAGARTYWYRVDSGGNETLITQDVTNYQTVSGDENYRIAVDVECPDPYSPTGFGAPGSAGITEPVLGAIQLPTVRVYGEYSLDSNTVITQYGAWDVNEISFGCAVGFKSRSPGTYKIWRLQAVRLIGAGGIAGPYSYTAYNTGLCGGGYNPGAALQLLNGSGIWQTGPAINGPGVVTNYWEGYLTFAPEFVTSNKVTAASGNFGQSDPPLSMMYTYEYGLGTYRFYGSQIYNITQKYSCSTGAIVQAPTVTSSGLNADYTSVYGLRYSRYERRLDYTCVSPGSTEVGTVFKLETKTSSGTWITRQERTQTFGTLYSPSHTSNYSLYTDISLEWLLLNGTGSLSYRSPTSSGVIT